MPRLPQLPVPREFLPGATLDHSAPPSDPRERLASGFVFTVWLVSSIVAIVFVWTFGSRFPYQDDFGIIPVVENHSYTDLGWLWEQVVEHRIPLTKLAMKLTWTTTDGDLRPAMIVNVMSLSLVAFLACRFAAQVRGKADYADSFFPLLLLNIGQATNFLWAIQSFFIWSACLSCIIIASFSRLNLYCRTSTVLALGTCSILLPMQGAPGVACAAVLALPIMLIGFYRLKGRSSQALPHGLLILAFAGATLVLVALHMHGLRIKDRGTADAVAVVRCLVKFFSTSLGYAGVATYRISGPLIMGMIAVTYLQLIHEFVFGPLERRFRVLLLGCALSACVALGCAIGVGRANEGGLAPRYITFTLPLWCATYFAWSVCTSDTRKKLAQMLLFFMACSVSVYNAGAGYSLGETRARESTRLQNDILDGHPVSRIAAEHSPYWRLANEDSFREELLTLRAQKRGLFETIAPDPDMIYQTLTTRPTLAFGAKAEGASWQLQKDPRFVFDLQKRVRAHAIRLKYGFVPRRGMTELRIEWIRDTQDEYARVGRQTADINLTTRIGPYKTTTFWVDDNLMSFAIFPGRDEGEFTLVSLELLSYAEADDGHLDPPRK